MSRLTLTYVGSFGQVCCVSVPADYRCSCSSYPGNNPVAGDGVQVETGAWTFVTTRSGQGTLTPGGVGLDLA